MFSAASFWGGFSLHLSILSPYPTNCCTNLHYRNRQKQPCSGKRQAYLSHQIQRNRRIIPYIPLKPKIYNASRRNLYRCNNCCSINASCQKMCFSSQSAIHFTDQHYTKSAGQKHRPMAVSPPEQFQKDISASAACKEAPHLSPILYFSQTTTSCFKHCIQYG